MTQVIAGKRAVTESIRAGQASEVVIARGSRRSPGLREVIEAAADAGVPVSEADRADLDRMARDHRGVIARVAAGGGVPAAIGEREMASFDFDETAIVVVLDGIEDPQNLGAAARSSEAAGAVMLVTRVHRAAPVSDAAIRASAGALSHLPHARVANIGRALHRLQDEGFTVIGLDETAGVSIYDEPCPAGRIAVVVGSEGAGMSRLVREACDVVVSLPMHGRVGSLNASASLAAVLYGYVLASRTEG